MYVGTDGLTREDVLLLLEQLSYETLYEADAFPQIRLQRKTHGYSSDPKVGRIQAALSIKLEVLGRLEEKLEADK